MTKPETGPEQKQVLQLYGALGAALVLSVMPFFLAAFFSGALFIGILIAAYIVRSGTDEASLLRNHTTFIIRTIWIGSFIAVLTMTAASIYLFRNIDNTPLDPCIGHFLSMAHGAAALDPYALMNIFRGCLDQYIDANFRLFAVSTVMAAGPVLLYFILRYARGLSRAAGGYRVARPEQWF